MTLNIGLLPARHCDCAGVVAYYAMAVCSMSVRLFVTSRISVKTAKHIVT